MAPLGHGRPAAVLVDLDETLIDSELSNRGSDLFASLAGSWARDDPDALVAEVDAHLDHPRDGPAQVHGAAELIRAWHTRGVPIALVTSNTRAWAEYAAEELLGVRDCFSALITGEDVAHGKPHPASYEAGCLAVHADPARALAIEDSAAGVRSAVAAGVGRVIGIAAAASADELRAAGAHQIAHSLAEITTAH